MSTQAKTVQTKTKKQKPKQRKRRSNQAPLRNSTDLRTVFRRKNRGTKIGMNDFIDTFNEIKDYVSSAQQIYNVLDTYGNAKDVLNPLYKGSKYLIEKGYNGVKGLFSKGSVLAQEKKVAEQEIAKYDLKLNNRPIYSGPSHTRDLGRTTTSTRFKDGSSIVSGSEILKVIPAVTSDQTEGTLIYSLDLNPATINLPQMRACIRNFEEYEVQDLEIVWQGAGGSTTVGSFVMFYDPDPMDYWTTSASLAKVAASARYRTFSSPREEFARLSIPASQKGKLYLDTDPNQERFQSLGRFGLVAVNTIPNGAQMGTLYMRYRIKLFATQTDPELNTGDFFNGRMQGTYGTSQMFDAAGFGSVPSSSTITIGPQTSDDWKKGALNFPAGSYFVTFDLVGTSMSWGSSAFTIVQTGKYAPWASASNGFFNSTSATGALYHRWVGCLSPFSLVLSASAGTWTALNLTVCATSGSPYASTFKQLLRLTDLKMASDREDEIIDGLDRDMVRNNQRDMEEKAEIKETKDDYFLVRSKSLKKS